MKALPENDAVAILRRIEPVLRDVQRDVLETKTTVHEMQREIIDTKVAVAGKPSRAELWRAMAVMVGLFALSLGGLPALLPRLNP